MGLVVILHGLAPQYLTFGSQTYLDENAVPCCTTDSIVIFITNILNTLLAQIKGGTKLFNYEIGSQVNSFALLARSFASLCAAV